MHNLANGVDLVEIVERLKSTKAEDRGLWGVMNAPEMLCHLRGAFRVAMGEIPVASVHMSIPPDVLKSKALWTPVPWHKNFETVPVLKRGTPTMQVGSFEIDRADVLAELERFCRPEQVRVDHSLFGPMSFMDGDIFTRIIISGSSDIDVYVVSRNGRRCANERLRKPTQSPVTPLIRRIWL